MVYITLYFVMAFILAGPFYSIIDYGIDNENKESTDIKIEINEIARKVAKVIVPLLWPLFLLKIMYRKFMKP